MKSYDSKKEAEFIINLISRLLSSKPAIKNYDSSTGKTILTGDSYEDLADYLPFLEYYSKKDLMKSEINKTLKNLKENDYIYYKKGGTFKDAFIRSYDQTDLIFGLILASLNNKEYFVECEKTINSWYDYFFRGKAKMFRLYKIPLINLTLPKKLRISANILSSEDHGMFIELFTLLFELTGKDSYLKKAHEVFERLKNTKEFSEKKYFPFYKSQDCFSRAIMELSVFKKRKGEFELIKQNSNTLFGIMALQRAEPNKKIRQRLYAEIKEIIDCWIKDYYNPEKMIFYTNYNHQNNKKGCDLTSFHIIELLINAHMLFKENIYLSIAEKIANSFIKHQSNKTGLFPFLHPESEQELKRFNIDNNMSWLDAEVDFTIALLRLYRASKKKKYFDSAKRTISGIVTYHKQKRGYCAIVRVSDGKIINSVYSTKMTALILKIFIAAENLENINKSGGKTYYLLQDR